MQDSYSDEKVMIKIGALCVFLVVVLDSSSFNQINALKRRVNGWVGYA